MAALPVGRYRQLLHQLLQLNEQAAALRRQLTDIVDAGSHSEEQHLPERTYATDESYSSVTNHTSHSPTENEDEEFNFSNGAHSFLNEEKQLHDELSYTDTTDHCDYLKKRNLNKKCECTGNADSKKIVCNSNNVSTDSQRDCSTNIDPNCACKFSLHQNNEVLQCGSKHNENSYRKPHFLDEDYHTKLDSCIPKPHFLEQSLSPEDERISIMNCMSAEGINTITNEKRSHSAASNGSQNFVNEQTKNEISVPQKDMLMSNLTDSVKTQASNESKHSLQKDFWPNQDSCSVKSFSSVGSGNTSQTENLQQMDHKIDNVQSLLSLLSLSGDRDADMSDYLFEISNNLESCHVMKQSGCIPLLVQLIHSKHSRASRSKAMRALHNIIHSQNDDKAGRREIRVLRLLEMVREYCYTLEDIVIMQKENKLVQDDANKHPVQSVAALMKLSFDEEHRHVMCQLGGLQSLASLVTIDQVVHGSLTEDAQCITMRKYSGMALTNLTFGDGNNKALLCSFKDFMISLVEQLQSPNDDMRQVTAAVLRNLSWRADSSSKQILREVGTVKGLMKAAMTSHKEATLKSILSALWNLTAHCSLNKVDICCVEGALSFLVDMLSFNAPSKTLTIIENAGGILRNVSSHIAVQEDYRQILRDRGCLKVLLQHLKSPSLTIVSNSCGTLWNLSARCQQDQQYLCDHGAVPMLRSLIHSKHKMIAMGSSAALKNLLNSKPGKQNIKLLDVSSKDLNLPLLPTLDARKQRTLEQEIDHNLSETFENIEPNMSPTSSQRSEKLLSSVAERNLTLKIHKYKMSSSSPLTGYLTSQIPSNQIIHSVNCSTAYNSFSASFSNKKFRIGNASRSDSIDSVTSTHSDTIYEKVSRNNCNNVNSLSLNANFTFPKKYIKIENILKDDNTILLNTQVNEVERTNFTDTIYDSEQYNCDQPIDYSQKYSETKTLHPDKCTDTNFSSDLYQSTVSHKLIENTDMAQNCDTGNTVVKYGSYQETDLDQPTDYSLRYPEENSDASVLSDSQPAFIQEDTIKYFCTEGTPYETPINFSNATSMSDLRMVSSANIEKNVLKKNMQDSVVASRKLISNKKCAYPSDTNVKLNVETSDIAVNSKQEVQPLNSCMLAYNSKYSSGLLSPEKPINYCEEGTPGCFSRVSSLSSLGEIGDRTSVNEKKWNTNNDVELDHINCETQKESLENIENKQKVSERNSIPVVPSYAEETPLMFSRCSSLGSISECSIPEQPDDIGSVVSEFSRLTSGCISPSELPDSPTQSPLPKIDISVCNKNVRNYKIPIQQPGRLRSVFEDEISTFQCEHTPIEFSAQTSLSSLTIDDEPSNKKHCHIARRSEGVGCNNPEVNLKDKNDRDYDDIEVNNIDLISIELNHSSTVNTSNSNEVLSSAKIIHKDSNLSVDAYHTYCTEDTPAVLSKVGSQSDLSVLSLCEAENEDTEKHCKLICENVDIVKKDYSDDSSNFSGESDNLLVECIRSGMPKKTCPDFILAKDEIEKYELEGSPVRYSPFSSLSDLTIKSKDTSSKARLIKSLDVFPCNEQNTKSIHNNKNNEQNDSSLHGSCDGSFSSVSVECDDDDHLLDMAVKAGVPKKKDESSEHSLINEPKKQVNKYNSLLSWNNVKKKNYKSEENDSSSSLSIDSMGSNDGEQALFEQCIKSGMPKSNIKNIDNTHPKCTDEKPKLKTCSQYPLNNTRYQNRSYKSLERIENDRDIEFESLVTAGAFGNCSKKLSKTTENINHKLSYDDVSFFNSSQRFSMNEKYTDVFAKGTAEVPKTTGVPVSTYYVDSPFSANLDVDKEVTHIQERKNIKATGNAYPKIQNVSELTSNKNNIKTHNIIKINSDSELNNICRIQKNDGRIQKCWSLEVFDTHELCHSKQFNNKKLCNTKKDPSISEIFVSDNKDHSNVSEYSLYIAQVNDILKTKPIEKRLSEYVCSHSTFVPMSENRDDISLLNEGCIVGLPDLLEKSIILSSDINQPDLTNKLSIKNVVEHTNNDMSHLSDDNNLKSIPNDSVIKNEAMRLACLMKRKSVDHSLCLSDSLHSNQSIDLENIKPPSQMNSLISLSQSLSSNWDDNLCDELNKNCLYKKSIQNLYKQKHCYQKMMTHDGSLDRTFSDRTDSLNNLDNIKPPSELDNICDLDNSMMFVDSIKSETVDIPNFNFDLTQPLNTLHTLRNTYNSVNIESINPPSLLDELTHSMMDSFNAQIDKSLTTDMETCISEEILKNDAMNTSKGRSLTPKQRRQLSKDRYRTYTIINSNEVLHNREVANNESPPINTKCSSSCKQRRHEDKTRYQTQTICIPNLNNNKIIPMNEAEEAVLLPERDIKKLISDFNKLKANNCQKLKNFSIIEGHCEAYNITEDSASPELIPKQTHIETIQSSQIYIEKNILQNDNLQSGDCLKTSTVCAMNISSNINTKNCRGKSNDTKTCECYPSLSSEDDFTQNFCNNDADLIENMSKPKIIKPDSMEKKKSLSNGLNNSDGVVSKAIRGRRKSPYISPYKRSDVPKKCPIKSVSVYKANKSNLTTTKGVNILNSKPADLRKPLSPSSKASPNVLKGKVYSVQKQKQDYSSKKAKKNTSNDSKLNCDKNEFKPVILVRERTFTKEENAGICKKKNAADTEIKTNNNSKLIKPGSIAKMVTNMSYKNSPKIVNKNTEIEIQTKMKNPRVLNPICVESTPILQSNDNTIAISPSGSRIANYNSCLYDSKTKIPYNGKMEEIKRNRAGFTKLSNDNTSHKDSNLFLKNVKTKLIRSSTFDESTKPISAVPTPLKQKSSINIKVSQLSVPRYKAPTKLSKPLDHMNHAKNL